MRDQHAHCSRFSLQQNINVEIISCFPWPSYGSHPCQWSDNDVTSMFNRARLDHLLFDSLLYIKFSCDCICERVSFLACECVIKVLKLLSCAIHISCWLTWCSTIFVFICIFSTCQTTMSCSVYGVPFPNLPFLLRPSVGQAKVQSGMSRRGVSSFYKTQTSKTALQSACRASPLIMQQFVILTPCRLRPHTRLFTAPSLLFLLAMIALFSMLC